MLPGSTEQVIIPTIEEFSGLKVHQEFGICINPEFMREGSSVSDFLNPPFTLIGGNEIRAIEMLKQLYKPIKAPVFCTGYRKAEMIKYVCN
jgi:UDP-glucose 6-dehydrogenase